MDEKVDLCAVRFQAVVNHSENEISKSNKFCDSHNKQIPGKWLMSDKKQGTVTDVQETFTW